MGGLRRVLKSFKKGEDLTNRKNDRGIQRKFNV